MRYGCCVNMVTRTGNVTGTDIVPVLKSLGFDYAELSLSHLCALSEPDFQEISSVLTGQGLPLEVCNNFFPSEIRLTGALVDRSRIIHYLDKAFARCLTLGIKTIVFGSGPARMVPPDFSFGKASEQLAELLRLINNYASEGGITIAIEPLRKQECNIVNTYREASMLAKSAAASQVRCLLDLFHLAEENESISEIHKSPGTLEHVHFAEPEGRVFPVFSNKQKYYGFFSEIVKAGYDKRISIEAYSENFARDAENALLLLKEIEREISINKEQNN